MPKINFQQIQNNAVMREHINIEDPGHAAVRKIVAGTGITLDSSGVDSGTGDVTINAAGVSAPNWSDILNKPTTFPPSAHTQAISTLTDHTLAAHQSMGLTDKNFGVTFTLGDGVNEIPNNAFVCARLPYTATFVNWYLIMDAVHTSTILFQYWNGSSWITAVTVNTTSWVHSGNYTGTHTSGTLVRVIVTSASGAKSTSLSLNLQKGQ